MKKTIPFKKKLTFKTNIHEITGISLENTLHYNENKIEGDLIITGTYKITEKSLTTEEFTFKLPVNIEIDKKYKDCVKTDIEDFYYEIIDNNILEVNIEILLDNLIEEEKIEEPKQYKKEERCIEEETKIEQQEIDIKTNEQKENINPIFDSFKEAQEEYSTYYVYIVREEDSLETIISKYNTTKEKLLEYNEITELKIGDKIIIPEKDNAGNK